VLKSLPTVNKQNMYVNHSILGTVYAVMGTLVIQGDSRVINEPNKIYDATNKKGCFLKFGVEVGVGESIESAPLV
jgi:hypothetical protein